MLTWNSAYDIKLEDGFYCVYKKDTPEMVAYCKTMEEAVKVANTYLAIVREVADDALMGLLGDELAD